MIVLSYRLLFDAKHLSTVNIYWRGETGTIRFLRNEEV